MKTLPPLFGSNSLDATVRQITPTSDTSDFRQKVARTYRFIGTAGRASRLALGLPLMAMGGCMIVGGVLLNTVPSAMPVAILGLLLIPIGLLVAMSSDARKIDSQLRAFEGVCHEATRTWRTQALINAEATAAEFQTAIPAWLKNELVGGTPVPEIREQLDTFVAGTAQLILHVEASLARASQRLNDSRSCWQTAQSAFRSAASRKTSQFLPGRVRSLARRVVASGEDAVKQERSVSVLESSLRQARSIAEQTTSIRNTAQSIEGFLLALRQEIQTKKRELTELSQSECLAGKPLPDLADVFAQGNAVAVARMQEMLESIGNNTESPIHEAMQSEIQRVVLQSEVTPRSFDAWWASADSSRRSMLLEAIDTGGSEFAVTRPIPGRIQQRIRHFLAFGGTSCPAFEPVKARSDSVLCRGVNHADQSELFIVTESRYEPASEIVEFVACAKTFTSIPAEVQSLAITAVDDDREIVDYEPEQRLDAERPYRLLVLGLLSGEIVRTGSEQYRELDITDPRNGHFGKGFEEAALAIRTDNDLAVRLDKRINRKFDGEGQAAVLGRIRAAFAKKDIVPTAVAPKFRQLLLNEYELRGGNVADLSLAA